MSRLAAKEIAELTAGRRIVGNVPSFDDLRLGIALRKWGYAPAWNYHLIDVEALAVGHIRTLQNLAAQELLHSILLKEELLNLDVTGDWNSEDISEALGVPVPDGQHRALDDALWAKDLYSVVVGPL
jgi:hypothetical protein